MKKDIHPDYFPNARVICACGNTFITGTTKQEIRTDVCSACHPFFTGEQRIVDTAGQVERFIRRLEQKQEVSGRKKGRKKGAAVQPEMAEATGDEQEVAEVAKEGKADKGPARKRKRRRAKKEPKVKAN